MVDASEQDAAAAQVLRAKRGQARRWTKRAEALFFEGLAAAANVSHACEIAGMSRKAAYRRKRDDPAFAVAWRRALEEGYAELEVRMLDHALHGSERTETVIDVASGEKRQVKKVHSYPHNLAVALLRRHREEVERFRLFEAAQDGEDEALLERVRVEMARVRARLSVGDGEAEA